MNNLISIIQISSGYYRIGLPVFRKYLKDYHNIKMFIESLNEDEVDSSLRFNSGDSYMRIKFKSEKQHLMFLLKWGHLIKKDMYYVES